MRTSDADQGDIVPTMFEPGMAGSEAPSIGTILIQAGRITLEEAQRILQLQRDLGIRFGAAAIQLGLLTQADIDFALARQFDSPYLIGGQSAVNPSIVTAFTPYSPEGQMFSTLRSQLMLRWFDETSNMRKSLAIVSSEHGDGRSHIAANLAVSFSQLGKKTLLIDADFRNPSQHLLFGLENKHGLSTVLAGRAGSDPVIQQIPGLLGLCVMTSGAIPPNPLELLARPLFPQLLSDLTLQFDIILIDTPATADCADAQAIAERAGAALIVARKNVTKMWRVKGISDTVSHTSATVVGTVLNEY